MKVHTIQKQDSAIIRLVNPSIIKKIERIQEEPKFTVDVNTNSRNDKKHKNTIKGEQENLESKKNKIKQKKKNRSKLYLNEEEALNEFKPNYYKSKENAAISLSIARPARPTSEVDNKLLNKRRKKKSIRTNKTEKKHNTKTQNTQITTIPSSIILEGPIAINELSNITNISHEEIIKFLFLQGLIVNINQVIDLATAKMVLNNFNIEINNDIENICNPTPIKIQEEDLGKEHITRAPVVTIMGHVDHGKTTLLDAIRQHKTKVAGNEAGGITQTIGTYEINITNQLEEKKITFLDTPGHKAFISMRERGAKLADIVILIIAADDGVKPQTEEALSYIQETQLPVIVAVTKIDQENVNNVNIDTIKETLTQYNLISEDWGGTTPFIPLSAKTGKNIDKLIETILLIAEVENLQTSIEKDTQGTIIESHLDKQQGAVAKVIVQQGTLKVGDILLSGCIFGKVRSIITQEGNKIECCYPSSIVQITGLSNIAEIGENFTTCESEKTAKKLANNFRQTISKTQSPQMLSGGIQLEYGINITNKKIQLIIKANAQGALESILYSIKNIPQEKIKIEILAASSGEITETDINLAASSNSLVIGFNTTCAPGTKQTAEKNQVRIQQYDIIYDLIEDVEKEMIKLLEPEFIEQEIGIGEIKATFNLSKGVIAGCYIVSGKLKKNSLVKVYKEDLQIYKGNLDSIKRIKEDVEEVESQQECGVFIENFQAWQSGHMIKCFDLLEQEQTL
nr:InfB [Erythrocladia irregularis]